MHLHLRHNARVPDVMAMLVERGMLLDSACGPIPSVAELVAGGPISGSWWAHPGESRDLCDINELADSPDVVRLRLVNGKITLVHRRVWPAMCACDRFPRAGSPRSPRSTRSGSRTARSKRPFRIGSPTTQSTRRRGSPKPRRSTNSRSVFGLEHREVRETRDLSRSRCPASRWLWTAARRSQRRESGYARSQCSAPAQ